MTDPTPIPDDVPGTLTLDQLRATVGGFGYQVVMVPKEKPKDPPGFAPNSGSGSK